MRRSLRSTLLVVPLLVAPLAACGTDEASAAEIVRAAPAATVEADTARMSFEMRMAGVPGMGAGSVRAEGAMDFAGERGSMTMDLGPMLEASGQQAPAGTSTSIEMVFEGSVFWMRFPMMTEMLGPEAAGKEWMRIDLSLVGDDLGVDIAQLQQMGGNDPRNQLAYLMGVTDEVEEVGPAEVRGVSTTHYRGTVMMSEVLDRLEEEDALVDRAQLEAVVGDLGTEELQIDVWIDEDGRARRMGQRMPAPPEAGGGEIQIVFDLYDFGAPVDIEIPPAASTVDFSEVLAEEHLGG